MSSTEPPSISGHDRTLSHLSFAPRALETPSRFASRTTAHVSPRSRRGRAWRAFPRLAGIGVVVLAAGAVLAFGWRPLTAFAAQAWRAL